MPDTPAHLHELVFTDRAARPAKWRTRCGRTDVLLEQTGTPSPASYYPVTCPACIRADEREACALLAEQGGWQVIAARIRARATP